MAAIWLQYGCTGKVQIHTPDTLSAIIIRHPLDVFMTATTNSVPVNNSIIGFNPLPKTLNKCPHDNWKRGALYISNCLNNYTRNFTQLLHRKLGYTRMITLLSLPILFSSISSIFLMNKKIKSHVI